MSLSIDSPLTTGEVHQLLLDVALPDTTIDVNSKVPLANLVIDHRFRLRFVATNASSAKRPSQGASHCFISAERPPERIATVEELAAEYEAVARVVRALLEQLNPHAVYDGHNQPVDWQQAFDANRSAA